jgi:hypothetical protein
MVLISFGGGGGIWGYASWSSRRLNMVRCSRARIEGPFRWRGAFLKCFPADSLVTTLLLSGLSGIVAVGVNLNLKVCEYHGSRLLYNLTGRQK